FHFPRLRVIRHKTATSPVSQTLAVTKIKTMLKILFSTILIIFISCNSNEKKITRQDQHEMTNSITDYWKKFQENNHDYIDVHQPQSFFFCDNKKDADDCAELVVKKIKQATSPSVWWFKKNNESLPKVGDIAIVTNWDDEPKAIIKTIKVE